MGKTNQIHHEHVPHVKFQQVLPIHHDLPNEYGAVTAGQKAEHHKPLCWHSDQADQQELDHLRVALNPLQDQSNSANGKTNTQNTTGNSESTSKRRVTPL